MAKPDNQPLERMCRADISVLLRVADTDAAQTYLSQALAGAPEIFDWGWEAGAQAALEAGLNPLEVCDVDTALYRPGDLQTLEFLGLAQEPLTSLRLAGLLEYALLRLELPGLDAAYPELCRRLAEAAQKLRAAV
jgi:hypothetical protein